MDNRDKVILEAIIEVRSELERAVRDSNLTFTEQVEVYGRLTSLYACLNVERILVESSEERKAA